MSKSKSNILAMVVAAAALSLGAGAAMTQQLNPGISCIEGEVPGNDWAELTSNYRESLWDTKAGMRARSDGGALELTVTDTYGSGVCDASIDDRARCRFSFSPNYSGTFNIRVTNSQSYATNYKLCAE